MTMGLMLVYHGTKMSSSPLILCSVTGLLIGLALTVVLPQVRAEFARARPAPPLLCTAPVHAVPIKSHILHARSVLRDSVLALRVYRSQALERLMTVMPSERIFIIFLVAPLLMFIWEHVVLDHQVRVSVRVRVTVRVTVTVTVTVRVVRVVRVRVRVRVRVS